MAPEGKGGRGDGRGFLEFQPDSVVTEQTPPARGARLALWLMLALALAAVLWAHFSEVDRIVVAPGKLVTTSPTIVVQPLDKSVVRSVRVRVGEVVKKDQVLAELDPTFTQADLNRLAASLASLSAEAERLRAEQRGVDYRPRGQLSPDQALQADLHVERMRSLKARLRMYGEKEAGLKSSLASLTRESKLLAERLAGLAEIERMRSQLRKERHESKLSVLEARDQRLNVQVALEEKLKLQAQLRYELANLAAERSGFTQGWKQEVTERLIAAGRELGALREQLAAARRKGELISLRSPSEAMVIEMAPLSPGSVVQQTQVLFKLVPLDVPLEAEVYIEPRDIGFVRQGDPARVKLDAFPFQKHGTIAATVRSISEDVVGGQAASRPEGAVSYLARLAIRDPGLRAVPKDYRLIPGMTLSAEIKVGKRSVLSYIIYPLTRAFDEGIREP